MLVKKRAKTFRQGPPPPDSANAESKHSFLWETVPTAVYYGAEYHALAVYYTCVVYYTMLVCHTLAAVYYGAVY